MKNIRVPSHVGVIPGGQKRWAETRGLPFGESLASALKPALELLKACRKAGVEQVTIMGSKRADGRAPEEAQASAKAWTSAVEAFREQGASVLVLADESSKELPTGLRKHLKRSGAGFKVNVLFDYNADWDLDGLKGGELRSAQIPDLELVLRFGGRRALGGFLPVQSREAELIVVDDLWPDFHAEHLEQALSWYKSARRH